MCVHAQCGSFFSPMEEEGTQILVDGSMKKKERRKTRDKETGKKKWRSVSAWDEEERKRERRRREKEKSFGLGSPWNAVSAGRTTALCTLHICVPCHSCTYIHICMYTYVYSMSYMNVALHQEYSMPSSWIMFFFFCWRPRVCAPDHTNPIMDLNLDLNRFFRAVQTELSLSVFNVQIMLLENTKSDRYVLFLHADFSVNSIEEI